ncbi:DNA-binding NarL/FixJ family response regulator [Paenibacillus phyllosphaerae]|uniref:DNA-binding NarL/FixJ family response regulator n=1 Tax=Paenibacillus phyllosphaerae TaxID=274593 RepID=A0A7W5FRH8_9BACL|nr:response regulator transcription factor [Paenibacillus phyllosphaerae]MBB3114358.1 DNA-binding NarL/FixJ family response regulator [Paenibacillus phyllosphaerae]
MQREPEYGTGDQGLQRPVRVLLADDHPHGREGMREILSGDPLFTIVGEAVHGEQAVVLAAEFGPDLVLMDINMPVMNGMTATQHIKSIDPRIKIVMVTVSDDITNLFEAIKRGAQGYLLKNLSPSSWLEYLRGIVVDEAPMSKELALRLLQEFSGGGRPPAAGRSATELDASAGPAGMQESAKRVQPQGKTALTQREGDILQRVAAGDSNRQIAEGFGLSEHTVKNHLKNILQKLHLENRVQLTRYAIEQGLLGDRTM